MAHDRVNVVADDFCFEEGMTKNQIESAIVDSQKVKELTYVGQDDVDIPTSSAINGNISTDFVNGVSSISGTAIGNTDGTNIGFEINTTGVNGLTFASDLSYPAFTTDYNGSSTTTKESLNAILGFKNFVTNNCIIIRHYTYNTGFATNFIWDMNKSRTATLCFRVAFAENTDSLKIYGSNNSETWTLINTLYYGEINNTDKTVSLGTAYRYYKVEFILYDWVYIYFMYLKDVEDSITKKKNKFTLDSTIVNN